MKYDVTVQFQKLGQAPRFCLWDVWPLGPRSLESTECRVRAVWTASAEICARSHEFKSSCDDFLRRLKTQPVLSFLWNGVWFCLRKTKNITVNLYICASHLKAEFERRSRILIRKKFFLIFTLKFPMRQKYKYTFSRHYLPRGDLKTSHRKRIELDDKSACKVSQCTCNTCGVREPKWNVCRKLDFQHRNK